MVEEMNNPIVHKIVKEMLSKMALPHLETTNLPINTGPPSPTLSTTSLMSSVSWMAEKTATELIPILKHVYKSLKDKEKDLVLAAEIGKSLLEQNVQLKNSYDKLVKSSTAAIDESMLQHVDSGDDKRGADSGIDSTDDEEADIRFVPSRGTREAMIEVLERKNLDLNQKLERTMELQDKNRRSHTKDTKKLENEISYLTSSLEIATNKIQELHEMNERQKTIELPPKSDYNGSVVERLYDQIDSIETEKEQLSQSKLELQSKLSETLKDLQKLKNQFEKFEFVEQDFKQLSEAYERQFSHIDQLNSSLKDHQNVLQKLKEKGVNIHSVRSTPAMSVIDDQDDEYQLQSTLLEELETQWLKANGSKPNTPTRSINESFQSLKEITEFTERSLTAFYYAPSVGLESVLSKATGIEQSLLDEALRFIDQIEKEHLQDKQLVLYNSFSLEQNSKKSVKEQQDYLALKQTNNINFNMMNDENYPSTHIYPNTSDQNMQVQRRMDLPNTFINRLKQHFRQLFKIVWKWCRFVIVLTTALCISAWQGPDALFIKK
ncbi:hypothetical protein K501DRAFT_338165 [Backusella circina FSU 941]|nr:hypothetical protein K501DRAFT_338165 [Backusella circina FSU 941]